MPSRHGNYPVGHSVFIISAGSVLGFFFAGYLLDFFSPPHNPTHENPPHHTDGGDGLGVDFEAGETDSLQGVQPELQASCHHQSAAVLGFQQDVGSSAL